MSQRAPSARTRVLLLAGLAGLAALLAGCAPTRGAAYEKSLADARRASHAGRHEEAAHAFDDAAKNAKVPRDAIYARYEAALARAETGDTSRAASELRAIADLPPPNAYAAQAAFKAANLTAKNDPARGASELEAVAVRFPESGVARVALNRVLRISADGGGPAAALARLDALGPKLQSTALAETVTYERAKCLAELGKTEAARDAFLDVATRWPYPRAYFDDALYRASELDEKLGRPEAAIADLERMLSYREKSTMIGSYERPRYIPAVLRIAKLYEERLHDRARAREALHRLYREFTTSTLRDDALWREAELWRKDGDNASACDRLGALVSDIPDSRYVPCAIERCPSLKRPSKSKAPATCHAYLLRDPVPTEGETPNPTIDTVRPDDPK